jgi:ribosomal protein S18 acetylase RimI-like enzyme
LAVLGLALQYWKINNSFLIQLTNMNISKITYSTKVASEEEIFLHLKECSTLFVPNLNETVDIQEYSKKIFQKSITFEAWVREKLIGLVAIYCNDIESHSAYITNVSIIKEYFGLGVAYQLLKMCISHVELNRFSTIILEVNMTNTPAVKLYKKYGFKIFESKESSFLMKLEFPTPTELSR